MSCYKMTAFKSNNILILIKPKTVQLVFDASQQGKQCKEWLAWNQNNVWRDMSTHGLLFQWLSTIKSNLACCSNTKLTSSSRKNVTSFCHNIAK